MMISPASPLPVWPAAPGRIFRIPERVLADADPSRGPVTLHVH